MFLLCCSILGSAMISVVMRLSQGKVKANTAMLSVNYLTCMVCAMCFTGVNQLFPAEPGIGRTLWMGGLNGGVYLGSLILIQYNVRRNGVVLQSVFSKLGDMLVPLAISILFFGERPGALQILGAILAIGAILAMNLDKNKQASVSMVALLLLFFWDGFSGAMSKIYEEVGTSALSSQFLLYTFGSAFLLSIVLVIVRKEKPGKWELLFGALVGIPNYFSSRFLLMALDSVPAVVAYPLRSVSIIVVVTLTGVFVFREKLRKRQWWAIAAVLAAVALLSI